MILKETIDFCRKIIKRFGSKEKVRIFAARFGKRGAGAPPPRWESCLKDGPLEVGDLKKVKKILEVLKKLLPLQPRSK